MNNNGSMLESILKKATFFSDEINRLRHSAKNIRDEKDDLVKKESELGNEILSTAEKMHQFLQETISQMSDLYTKTQHESESESEKDKIIEQDTTIEQKDDKKHTKPLHATVLIKKDDKNSKVKKTEIKSIKQNKNLRDGTEKNEEVYLFDL